MYLAIVIITNIADDNINIEINNIPITKQIIRINWINLIGTCPTPNVNTRLFLTKNAIIMSPIIDIMLLFDKVSDDIKSFNKTNETNNNIIINNT